MTLLRPLLLLLVTALASSGPALGDFWYEHYEEAQKALKKEKWLEAVEQLNLAIERKRDSGARARASGMRTVAYFPHLKLGIAYYQLGQLDDALQAFETEERLGAIKEGIREAQEAHRELQAYREQARQAAAADEAQRVREIVQGSLDESRALEESGRLDEAIEALGEGLAVDPESSEARNSLQRLRNKVAQQAARRASAEIAARRLDEAVTAAREAISTAHGAARTLEDLLEDPDRAIVWQQSPALTVPEEAKERLEAARQKLDLGEGASDLSMVEDAQREADVAKTAFEEVGTRAEQRSALFVEREVRLVVGEIEVVDKLAEEVYELREDPELSTRWRELFGDREIEAEGFLSSARRHLDSGREQASLSDLAAARRSVRQAKSSFESLQRAMVESREKQEVTESTEAETQPSASSLPEVQRLVKITEQILDLIGNEPSGSHLLESQRSRLKALVEEAGEQGQRIDGRLPDGLYGGLLSSMAALQLLAAAEAYFSKEYQRTVDILATREISSDAFASQALLFRAAALFSLYAIGGETEDSLRDEAAAAVRSCRSSDPELEPVPRLFSPRFREFFDRN